MTDLELLEAFYLSRRARNLRPRSLEFYAYNLRRFVQWCSTHNHSLSTVGPGAINSWLTSVIASGIRPPSVNCQIRAVRAFYHYCSDPNEWDGDPPIKVNPCTRAARPLREESAREKVLNRIQIERLLHVLRGPGFAVTRNRALVMVMLDSGVRPSEISGARIESCDLRAGTILVRAETAKSRRERFLPLSPKTIQWLHRYLTGPRGGVPGDLLFPSSSGERLSTQSISRILHRIGRGLGFRCTPKVLRHTFATLYLANGGPLHLLRLIMGHSDIRVTTRYLHPSTSDITWVHQNYSPLGLKYSLDKKTESGIL